ncbi:MAG: hypothetical protein DWQ35_13885 [Planctomycetota bacterium]|nr:MAG: hypothetical protein DWQ35_13885 [Planctomycetota bacterium]REK25966.1 MAG: hypothetical protein DWQ42_10070 [Planctomycetota bacterium]REK46918.1 MAG: hypothetical protein DWQ46_05330 [Planctomycetota bacterium]
MIRGRYIARQPPDVRVLSALKCGERATLTSLDNTVVSPLISAAQDADETIRQEAVLAISELTHPKATAILPNQLCDEWVRTRSPLLEDLMVRGDHVAEKPTAVRVLSALRCGKVDLISRVDSDGAREVIQALDDQQEVVRQRAREAIAKLSNPEARVIVANWLCPAWAEARDAEKEELVLSGKFVPDQPLHVRVLCALKTGQIKLITDLGPEVVEHLIEACRDADTTISEGASKALRRLRNKDSQEAFCRLVLEQADPSAMAIAKDTNYAPKDDLDRALYLFLTEQWDRYETFDFDHRLMRSVYEAADASLRGRITEKLRIAGRTDFLTVISGRDYRSRAGEMTANEIKFVVNTLVRNQEWDRLWELVFELPLSWSIAVVRQLASTTWVPKSEDDRETLAVLASLAAEELPTSLTELGQHIPPAVRRASAHVSGRVSDVAFSPHRPVIAIGGRHQAVVWNFQTGTPEAIYRGFSRSVGSVMFTEDDCVVCAEGLRPGRNCILHSWCNGQRCRREHEDMITSLTPAGSSHILITRRDSRAILFDVAQQTVLKEQSFDFWPRAACVSPDGKQALLLHQGVTLIDLPDMSIRAQSNGRLSGGVSRCAAFSPSVDQHVIGKFNGDIFITTRKGTRLWSERERLTKCDGRTQGIEMIPGQHVVIVAGARGSVEFLSWETRSAMGSVHSDGERLTSLHIAPGGDFMAIGDTDSSMSFWDLRVMQIPLLFSMPFARARPTHLGAVQALSSGRRLPDIVKRCVAFMECVLRYRFRYDIEVGDIQSIRVGEFDIEIE